MSEKDHDFLFFVGEMLMAVGTRDRAKLDDLVETEPTLSAIRSLSDAHRQALWVVWLACKAELNDIHSETTKPNWVAGQ